VYTVVDGCSVRFEGIGPAGWPWPVGGRVRVEYQGIWSARSSVDGFGETLVDAWTAAYLSQAGDKDEMVVVDPGNGFDYVFDLAGTLGDEVCGWAPRVIGVWGRCQPGGRSRDRSRMRGFPRPSREHDDRGHLIACTAGGGYDINLVSMDSALNRGRSMDGARFRALERRGAATPGTLFFVRPVYDDDSDRPCGFDVGVQDGEDLIVEVFANHTSVSGPVPGGALRQAAALPFDAGVVAGCLDADAPNDVIFARGWRSGPSSLTRVERNTIAGVTGHVAESVAELLLDAVDWHVLWHFIGPGRHGVDLVFLSADDKVVAIEVKGTLVSGRIRHLTRRDLTQMSPEWLDKADNPGMAELGISSDDAYGGVVIVNFADLTWRIALTADFSELRPVTTTEQLTDLDWINFS
jgi:hypothetical protein